MKPDQTPNRRKFLRTITASAAVLHLTSVNAAAKGNTIGLSNIEEWFNQLNGKHKMVFDAISANDGFQVVWAFTFMETSNETGTPDNELSALVVLRNKAIALAMEDRIWKKYKFGKYFKITDRSTNAAADRNLFWDPKGGEMPEHGMSIKKLQARGVLFCVCEKAITLNSKQHAMNTGGDPDEIKKDWLAGIIPGIQPMPSGVWALNRAQEHGASYCYAG